MTTIKTLYFKDYSQTEAKLVIAEWGEEYCPYIGAEVYSETRKVIFLDSEKDIHAAQEVADAQYYTHIPNSAVDVEKWEDIRV